MFARTMKRIWYVRWYVRGVYDEVRSWPLPYHILLHHIFETVRLLLPQDFVDYEPDISGRYAVLVPGYVKVADGRSSPIFHVMLVMEPPHTLA